MKRSARSPKIPGRLSRWIRYVVVALALFVNLRRANASGLEQVNQAWSLRVAFDSRWCGCGAGGYYPVRVKLTNLGAAREFTLTVGSGARVVKRIKLAQNETQFCTLSVPLVSNENYFSFALEENGLELKEFHVNFSIVRNVAPRPALLIVDHDGVSRTAFENGANLFAALNSGGSHYGYRSDDSEIVSGSMLPDHWIDYSGLDVLATSFTVFKSLPASVQSAILTWVETGGNLIVYDLPPDPSEIDLALQVKERAYAVEGWRPSDDVFDIIRRNRFEHMPAAKATSTVTTVEAAWPNAPESIKRRNLQLGQVFLFASSPFPGSMQDWVNWIDATGLDRLSWSRRTGIGSPEGQTDFYEFLVPGVGDVPIIAFLCIVTVFAIVIGPVNYWFFYRRKQLHLLLLTTPLIAILTSTFLFIYAAASDGFGIRSRTTSVTLLDHRSESAVTLQRLCFFAGLAPFDGMRFSNETAVFPFRPPNTVYSASYVDLTQGQHLTSGWLPSRTMTQYELITRRKERARVEVTRVANVNEMQFASGLPWHIEYLLLVDENGQEYYGENLKAGGTAKLRIATSDDRNRMHNAATNAKPVMPVGVTEGYAHPRRYAYTNYQTNRSFVANAPREKMLAPLYNYSGGLNSRPFVDRRHYLAILSDKPGLEQGINSNPSNKDLNVLIGDY